LRDAYPNNDSINPLTDQIQQAAAPPKWKKLCLYC